MWGGLLALVFIYLRCHIYSRAHDALLSVWLITHTNTILINPSAPESIAIPKVGRGEETEWRISNATVWREEQRVVATLKWDEMLTVFQTSEVEELKLLTSGMA